jgi:hypothetical protein
MKQFTARISKAELKHVLQAQKNEKITKIDLASTQSDESAKQKHSSKSQNLHETGSTKEKSNTKDSSKNLLSFDGTFKVKRISMARKIFTSVKCP